MKRYIVTLLFILIFSQAAEARDVLVLLKSGARQCKIGGTSYVIRVASGGVTPAITGSFSLSYAGGGSLSAGAVSYAMPVTVTSSSPIIIDGVSYHGSILFEASGSGFNIVNQVDVEQYLKGVLKDEMSPAWPVEALKAQAVLARTYTLSSKKHGKYDLCAQVHCQSYSGVAGESPAIDEAVSATGGELLKYGGSVAQVFYYGEGEKADYRIGNLKKSQNGVLEAPGIEFTMSGALDADIRVNLPGDFNMYNAAAAVAIAHDMGISTDIINKGLTHLRIRGRFDIVFNNGHFAVCVDFAHNGYSTRNHLEALREYHPKRIVCVFGADGNRSKYRRYEMGEASALLADLSIVTAGHNRYETFDQIFADIKIGIDKAQKEKAEPVSYLVIPNRKEAIRYAIEHAQEGDMITILGLGHESYQEENGVKTPHSDIQFAAQCCKEYYPQG